MGSKPHFPTAPMSGPKRVKTVRPMPECRHGRPPPCELCHAAIRLRFARFRLRCAWDEFKGAIKELFNGR